MVILFVGSNPSNSSICDGAFHESTVSGRTLTEWCQGIVGMKMHINVLNKKTEDNRALKKDEIENNLEQLSSRIDSINADRIVALGKTAASALSMLGVSFYEMPHPSGLNRQLNDKEYVAGKIRGLQQYCLLQSS